MKKFVLLIITIFTFQSLASIKVPLIDANESHTHRSVYFDDYAVVILVQGPVKDIACAINEEIAKHHKECAPIVPHIALFQGQLPITALPQMMHQLKQYAATLNRFKIIMESKIEKDYESNNTI